MGQETGVTTLSVQSPSGNAVKDPQKRRKCSYTREFLFSLAKFSTRKLSREAYLQILHGFEDELGLISPPFSDSDSRSCRSMPQHSAQEVLDNCDHLLHKSYEPYRPPRHYKVLPTPSRKESNDPDNNETPVPSDCLTLEKSDSERQRGKGVHEEKSHIVIPGEDKWQCNKQTDTKESSGSRIFVISPALGHFDILECPPNAISKQLDSSHEQTLNQGAVKSEGLHLSILPVTIKNCSTQQQLEQDITANNTVNLQQNSVNHVDASQHFLSVLKKDMYFKESGAYSNFNEGHPDRIHHPMESPKKSRPPSFFSLEAYGNLNKDQLEAAYEKGLMELQLNDGSIHNQDSPGRIAKVDVREACVSPPPLEDRKLLISMVDKCELDRVHCEGISSLHGLKQDVSISMKKKLSGPDLQIEHELELNFFSGSNESDSSIEIILPDEDSLITFDEQFLIPDEANGAFVDDSMFKPKSNHVEADIFSPSSPREMIEKLVDFVLNDENSAVSHPDDSTVQQKAGLEGFCHSPHAQQSYTQLSPGRDQQAHNSFHWKSINTTTSSSLTNHCLPSKKIHQPFPFCHDDLRRIDHGVNHPMVQQMVNPEKLHFCSFCRMQRGVTQHLPKYQVTSCPNKLTPMQYSTPGYLEPSYQGFIKPNIDSPAERRNNQAVVDNILDIKLTEGYWHPYPYTRGFW